MANEQNIVTLNSEIYSTDVVFSATYVLIDKGYFKLDLDGKNITVEIIPKKGFLVENLKNELLNELVNYSCYKNQLNANKNIRDAIIQRSLVTNDPTLSEITEEDLDEETKKLLAELENTEDDQNWLDDPEGIAIPWEEKYGKGNKNKTPIKKIKSAKIKNGKKKN